MEDYTTVSFVLAYMRFSCNNGHVKIMSDKGKNIKCRSKNMKINWIDVNYQLHADKVIVNTVSVGDHHEHRKVECKICQIVYYPELSQRFLINSTHLADGPLQCCYCCE